MGVDKLVMMLGALHHIEDKIHQMTGKLLRDSGETTVLSQAQVLPSGLAQTALNEHHIKRSYQAPPLCPPTICNVSSPPEAHGTFCVLFCCP